MYTFVINLFKISVVRSLYRRVFCRKDEHVIFGIVAYAFYKTSTIYTYILLSLGIVHDDMTYTGGRGQAFYVIYLHSK